MQDNLKEIRNHAGWVQERGNEMKILQQKIAQLADTDVSLTRDLEAECNGRKVLHTAFMTCASVLVKS